MDNFANRPRGLTHFQRANELVLRVSAIAEAFSGGTATVSYESTTHELPRAIYESILRDESRHRRLAGLYFEWALSRIDDEELARLGQVLFAGLQALAPFWKPRKKIQREIPAEDLQALGWLGSDRFAPVALEVVERDILDPLATIGIMVSAEQRTQLTTTDR